MLRVVNLEIFANNPEITVNFYGNVECKIEKLEPFEYWLLTTRKDEMGVDSIMMLDRFDIRIANTIIVDNYDEFSNKIIEAGGKSISGTMYIPKLGFTGTFQDTEGNKFAILEYEKN